MPAASRTARTLGCLGVALAVLAVLGFGAFFWLRDRGVSTPVPGQQRCVATANDRSVSLDLDQAHFASIIVGVSVKRGLAARAASIALATAYQETGIRNLDYGDRDSVGLFQQRPSQGWGAKKKLLDPYYATGKFYDALVKIDDWETDDINDVAQKVQRSGYPEAYRDHEADARVVASALTGNSPAGFTCLERAHAAGDTDGLLSALEKTFGSVADRTEGSTVTIDATSTRRAWAYAHFAVANSRTYGVTVAGVDDQRWETQELNLPAWAGVSPALAKRQVQLTVR